MTIIDTDVLARLRDLIGGDEEDLAELIQDFTETAPDLVDEMVASTNSGDWVALKIAATHSNQIAKTLAQLYWVICVKC